MELRQYLSPVLKWWWLVIISIVIASTSSYVASSRITPLYHTKATLMVGTIIQNPDPSSAELYTGQQLANTYIQMVTREPVLKVAVDSLGWEINWELLASQVKANIVPQTQLIEVHVTDSDPYRAKILADTLAQQLIQISPSGKDQITENQLDFIRAQLEDLNNKITSAQEKVKLLEIELDTANSARQIMDIEEQISVHETKITNWQNNYTELLKSIEGGDVNALRIVEEATIPTSPFTPNIGLNVLLAAGIGLVLSVGGIFLIEYLDDTIRTTDDTQRLVNLPILAKIGRINNKKNGNILVALENPLSPIVDAFRMLRMNIQSISPYHPMRTILFTSVEPSVGKSMSVSNLAIVMAQYGYRVILVEADFRKPSIHKFFELTNENGLLDLIEKPDLTVLDYLKGTKIENLRILTSGIDRINSVEALGSERMNLIIEELNSIADIVLFDSPPVLMFSDPFLMGKLVDGVILVSKEGKTRKDMIKRVVNDLRMAGINLVGIVIQHQKSSDSHGYRYYRHYSESENK